MDLRATLAYARVKHAEECPDIGPACASSPPPESYRHDVKTVVSELPLEVSYGVLPWLAVEARVPLRIVGVWPRYYALDGEELPLIDEHHRRETLVGPADPWLTVRVGGAALGLSASARAGVSIPLGRTEVDPYALGRLGLPHQHIQFGSGTAMPVVGGVVQRAWSRFELGFGALAVVSLVDNEHGYRAPSRAFMSSRGTFPMLGGELRPYAAADLSLESSELWHGRVGDEGPTDRADLLVGAGVKWQWSEAWAFDGTFRVRVAKLSDGSALDYPGFVQLGGTWTLDPDGEGSFDEGSSNW